MNHVITAYGAYRTMTNAKKIAAQEGVLSMQEEWLQEEIHELFEAAYLHNLEAASCTGQSLAQLQAEVIDEAMGLIRTVQQFPRASYILTDSTKAMRVLTGVIEELVMAGKFSAEYRKYEAKKHAKGQALDMTLEAMMATWDALLFGRSLVPLATR